MRAYLCQAFKKVYGSYGASDLEINIGVENDFVINIRKLMLTNERLRRRYQWLARRSAAHGFPVQPDRLYG